MKRAQHVVPLNIHFVLYAVYTGTSSTALGLMFAASVATPLTPSETWLAATGVLSVLSGVAWPLFWWRRARRVRENTI